MAVEREVLIEAPDTVQGMKISWGGVFGGVLAGVGVLMLLSSLGLAIGVSAVDPRNPNGDAIGTGAAIWTALTLLISLFVGGWASTRLSLLWERTTAMFEGVLVWVLSLIIVLYLAASGVGLVASGAFSMVGQAAQTATADKAVSNNPDQAAADLRSNAEQLAARARERLPQAAAEAQPEVSTTAWVTFAALVLSLLAAIGGAAMGRRGVERKVVR
jgi:ABC-type transport system involved in multi-copper enzyme maturation permease subunit